MALRYFERSKSLELDRSNTLRLVIQDLAHGKHHCDTPENEEADDEDQNNVG